jgi:hypothetical protein
MGSEGETVSLHTSAIVALLVDISMYWLFTLFKIKKNTQMREVRSSFICSVNWNQGMVSGK